MGNSLNLIIGKNYRVRKSFVDFDRITHKEGECWIYEGTNFLPYDDGLTLHVLENSRQVVYRLQWRKEEQADIIERFNDYVEIVK